jgi:hypothetical protein
MVSSGLETNKIAKQLLCVVSYLGSASSYFEVIY